LCLHPTGTGKACASGGVQENNKADLSSIAIELSAQSFDGIEVSEWFLARRELRLRYKTNNPKCAGYYHD